MASLKPGDHGESVNLTDLTVIRGVGMVRKRWLNAIGIHSLADLAAASANAIAEDAKHEGHTLSPTEIESWIQQAQAYDLDVEFSQSMATASEASASTTVVSKQSSLEVSAPAADTSDRADWQSVASLKLDIQTRQIDGEAVQRFVVHHQESGETEVWEHLEAERLQRWCRDREKATLHPLPISPSLTAEITRIRILQPRHMAQPVVIDKHTPIIADLLDTAAPFALEVSVQFADPDHADLDEEVAYQVQCSARSITTGVTHQLGAVTAQGSRSPEAVHNVFFPSLRLLQAGDYRLKIFLTVPQMPAVSDHFKVPLLQVLDFDRIGTCSIA